MEGTAGASEQEAAQGQAGDQQPGADGGDADNGGFGQHEHSPGEPDPGLNSQGNPQTAEAAGQRPVKNPVQAFYRWKQTCKGHLKKGIQKGAIAVFCILSPAGRWSCRGSNSLIHDPAFEVIEQQLQQLAMSRFELRAAQERIFRSDRERRRSEQTSERETTSAAGGSAAGIVENQRLPSKQLRSKARQLWNTPAFRQKREMVRNAHSDYAPCDKVVCRTEHLGALATAPCYSLRQAMGWPDTVPFVDKIGDLTTKELANFVGAFAAFESLQPMYQEGQGTPGQDEQTAGAEDQAPACTGLVTMRAINAFNRSHQIKVPSKKPRVLNVPVRLELLAAKILAAGGNLQFRRRGGYLAFIYDKEGLNFRGSQAAGNDQESEGDSPYDSDYAERKEEEGERKLKGLYQQFLKSYKEWRLGESEEEGETDSESERSQWGPEEEEDSASSSDSDGYASEALDCRSEEGGGNDRPDGDETATCEPFGGPNRAEAQPPQSESVPTAQASYEGANGPANQPSRQETVPAASRAPSGGANGPANQHPRHESLPPATGATSGGAAGPAKQAPRQESVQAELRAPSGGANGPANQPSRHESVPPATGATSGGAAGPAKQAPRQESVQAELRAP